MKIRKAKVGFGLILGALTLLIAVFLALLPSIHSSTRNDLANLIWDAPSKIFDLSEATRSDPVGIVVDLLPALLSGRFPAKVEELRLDIKFKNYRKIQSDRGQAMEAGMLREPVSVPATLEYGSKSYRARVRLKGRLTDHWMGPDRWSLRVRLRGGKTIRGLNQFSLQRPRVRQIPFDQMFQFWGRKMGIMTPDFEFFRLYVNGDYWGIALAEEHMSKHFLERNRRKEAPLIKLSSVDYWYYLHRNSEFPDAPKAYYGVPDVSLYSESAYRDDGRMRSLFGYGAERYRSWRQGEFPLGDLIDIPSFTRALLLALAWNHQHALHDANSRYYLNPYTLLLEPVTTDQPIYGPFNTSIPSANPPFAGSGRNLPLIYQHLIQEDGFYAEYAKTIEEMKDSLPSLRDEHQRVCESFPFDCPEHDEELLASNIRWLEEEGERYIRRLAGKLSAGWKAPNLEVELGNPTPPDPRIEYPEHVYAEYREGGVLRLYNLVSHPVEVRDIRAVCKSDGGRDDGGDEGDCVPGPVIGSPFILHTGKIGSFPYYRDLELRQGHVNDSKQLLVTTALGEEIREIRVRFSTIPGVMNPLVDLPVLESSGNLPDFMQFEGDAIRIVAGTWMIDKPLILPVDRELIIDPGADLRFAPDAYLLVRGRLLAEGSEARPIVLGAADKSWRGLYVSQAPGISRLRHVIFEDTNFLEDGALQLTGAVNFYRSDVMMENVSFHGSRAEDALNIIESKFELIGTDFREARSDAFDADYSDGVIKNASFVDIGGDALDTSGSTISGEHLFFEAIVDKAISAGEASHLKMDHVLARDIGAAVVSKDGSDLSVQHLSVIGARVAAGMAYRKKSIYGPASLTISSSEIGDAAVYNQIGSDLTVNGISIDGVDLDVDALYREGPMKKLGREDVVAR